MPNGKGFLDCRYCVHAWPLEGWPLLFGSRTRCLYHQKDLPQESERGHHRLCIHFQPSELYFSEQFGLYTSFSTVAQQFARFGAELEPGVLYEYSPQDLNSIQRLSVLREPDYGTGRWMDPTHRSSPTQIQRNQWSNQFRLNAAFSGAVDWYFNPNVENLREYLPRGGALFQSICLRMPIRWELKAVRMSISQFAHVATFGDDQTHVFELVFRDLSEGWFVTVSGVANTTDEEVRDFLLDLHQTIESTEGVVGLLWFQDDMLQNCLTNEDVHRLGASTPFG